MPDATQHHVCAVKRCGSVWWEEPADPADPLLALPQVVLTPHIAGDTAEAEQRLAELTADNVRLLARGESPRYVVGVDVDAGS